MTDSASITKELAKGKFTDQMLADMRALIGTELRTEACLNNEYATRLAIMRFCEGIGDDNPLVDRRRIRRNRPARHPGRAAQLHLRLPRFGAGRLAAAWAASTPKPRCSSSSRSASATRSPPR